MRTSTLPDGLPVLSRGRHRNARRGACFMELASVLAGERWSDHPPCTHPLLAQLARQVNDSMTDVGRRTLPPLVPSVVGRLGDADTPLTLSVAVATRHLLDLPESAQRVLAAGLLRAVETCGEDSRLARTRAQAEAGLELVPGALDWVERLDVRGSISATVYDERCAPTMVRCAVEGVVRSGGPDVDDRLRDLLETGIAAMPVPSVAVGRRPAPSAQRGRAR